MHEAEALNLDPAVILAAQFDDVAQQREAQSLGMWVFLATEVMMFGALFLSYTVYRYLYPTGFLIGSQHLDKLRGAIDAAILLTSSLTMSFAIQAAQVKRRWLTAGLLLLTMGLGLSFLGIEASEYRDMFAQHLFPGPQFSVPGVGPLPQAKLFFVLFFTLVSLHGLHVCIGVLLLGVLLLLTLFDIVPHHDMPVELVGLYWHFVDLVFGFLFPLFYLIQR